MTDRFYYWKTHTGAELDLLLFINGKRIGFEVKYADAPAPSSTKSMHSALETLGLDKLYIIYPGSKNYPLTEKIEAMPIRGLLRL